MPAGALHPAAPAAPPPATRPPLASTARRWTVLVLAVAQVLAAAVATALGSGRPLGASGGDLLVTPAGYGSAVWGVVVAGCLAAALYQLPAARGDGAALRRVAWPFAGAMACSTAWLVVASAAPSWVALALFAALVALLALAYDTALRHRRLVRLPGRLLVIGALGVFAGWSAVVLPVNLAAAAADLGAPTAGGGALAWQAGALLLSLGAGFAVVRRWRARAASTLAAVWGLLAVAVGAGGRDGGALLAGVAAVGAVVLLGWAVWSRWEDLRRRVEASTVRLGRGPVV